MERLHNIEATNPQILSERSVQETKEIGQLDILYEQCQKMLDNKEAKIKHTILSLYADIKAFLDTNLSYKL